MKITIDIDETRIAELVEAAITRQVVERETANIRHGVSEGIDKAIKAYIYSKKDDIIDRVVNRASREIIKKGLPKFLANMGKELI